MKVLQKLDVYPLGIKGCIKFIVDFFKNDEKKRIDRKRKYIFMTRQNHEVDSMFQEVRLNVGLLDDIYMDIPESERTQDSVFGFKYLPLREKLEIEINKGNSNMFINTICSKEFKTNTQEIMRLITSLTNEYNNRSNLAPIPIRQIICQLEKVKVAIENYITKLEKRGENVLQKYAYTFDLCEQMYYNASENDILNVPQINCLGLIKNVGTYMYELEVIALYL